MIIHIIQEAYDGEDGYDACEEHLWHVHVIEEVDQLLAAWRAIVLTRLKRSTMKQNVWQSLLAFFSKGFSKIFCVSSEL